MGAPWPNDVKPATTAGPAKSNFDLQQRKATHWAWQPIQRFAEGHPLTGVGGCHGSDANNTLQCPAD